MYDNLLKKFLENENDMTYSLLMEYIYLQENKKDLLEKILNNVKNIKYKGLIYFYLFRYLEAIYFLRKSLENEPSSFIFFTIFIAISSSGASTKILEIPMIEIDKKDEYYHHIMIIFKLYLKKQVDKEIIHHIKLILENEWITEIEFILIFKCMKQYYKKDFKLLKKIRNHTCFRKEYYKYIDED